MHRMVLPLVLFAFTALAAQAAAQSNRTLSGAAIGAGSGAIIAGPVGAVAGGVIGAVVGGPSFKRGRHCWRDRHRVRHCR